MRRDEPLLGGTAPPPSKNFALWPFKNFNHNVVVCWSVVITSGVADSIWSGTVLAAYLYELMGSNAYAGYAEAAQGLTSLLFALPVGWAADRGRKARIVVIGGGCIVVAAAATSFAVIYGVAEGGDDGFERTLSYGVFIGAMCLWGLVNAVTNGPAQAIYADSTPAGQRSWYYTILFGLYLLASTLGPLVTIVMFVLHGNEWELADIRNVILAGMGIELLCAAFMLFFRDEYSLTEADEAAPAEPAAAPAAPAAPMSPRTAATAADAAAATALRDDRMARRKWLVPWITFFSSLCFALGSGMTVKFFPLFFKNDCAMSPVGVQCIYIAVPVLMALMSGIGTKLSKCLGRAQTMVLLKIVGVALLCSMAYLNTNWLHDGGGEPSSGDGDAPIPMYKVVVVVAIYLLRTGLMNCTYPLEESILMDFVPKETRARWKSLDSISQFGWCGSAALGGWLADKYSYGFTFYITAAVQGAAIVMQAALIFIVPRSEAAAKPAAPAEETTIQ